MLVQYYRQILRAPNFRGKSRIEGILRRMLRPAQFSTKNGFQMELDPCEWAQIEIMKTGLLEPLTTAMIGSILSPGVVFVDVGAHVGFHSLSAAKAVGTTGKVVAIDPQPYNCNLILKNSHINAIRNIIVCVMAAGDRDGFLTLFNQLPTDKSRLSVHAKGAADGAERFIVPMRRLDGLLGELVGGRICLMKLDVEGFEMPVLRGLGEDIARVDNIVVEVISPGSEAAKELAQFLTARGFDLKTMLGEDWRPGQTCPENNVLATR